MFLSKYFLYDPERWQLTCCFYSYGIWKHYISSCYSYVTIQIIRAARKLELQVRNVGRVPGSFETHQGYSWVDPVGRSVSPPPEIDRVGRYDTRGERKSGLMLLKDSDERKVLF